MQHLTDILTHIEASAPCSLFSVAAWADEQLTINAVIFAAAIDTLISSNAISVSQDANGLVVDLI